MFTKSVHVHTKTQIMERNIRNKTREKREKLTRDGKRVNRKRKVKFLRLIISPTNNDMSTTTYSTHTHTYTNSIEFKHQS